MSTPQRKFARQIREMVAVCHAIAARQYVTSQGGNLSWRVDADHVLITPTRVNKGAITPKDIVVLGLDGVVRYAAPGRKPTGESYIHLGILRKRPDIASVIHAHPPWLTAFAISKPELLQKPWLPEPVIEVGPMALTDYAQPITEELARKFDPFIERYNAFLMRNHGVVLLSVEGLARCFELLEMMEVTAQTVAIAHVIGNPKPLPRSALNGLAQTMRTRAIRLPGLPGKVKTLEDLYR
jgi:L-fuculose-phosphate aldolase